MLYPWRIDLRLPSSFASLAAQHLQLSHVAAVEIAGSDFNEPKMGG